MSTLSWKHNSSLCVRSRPEQEKKRTRERQPRNAVPCPGNPPTPPTPQKLEDHSSTYSDLDVSVPPPKCGGRETMKPLPAMRSHHALLLVWIAAWATMPQSAFTAIKRPANLPASYVSPTSHGFRRPHTAATKLFLSGFSLGLVACAAGSHRMRRQKFCRSSARQSVGTSLDPSFGLKQDPKGRRLGTSKLTGFEEFMAQLVGAPEGPVHLDEADYRAHVLDAQEQMKTLATSSEPFTLDQSGNAGSIYGIGRREYQKQHGRLNLSRLRGIISFDSAARTVTTGAKTDFKTLTRFLLDRGFIVPVVPEVDTVTVGGAISGIVMEAASFRHGFVHNTVQSMEVLLPDGSVVLCSRQDNAELFNAIPHSYGTFGYVLSATMLVVPAQTEVMLGSGTAAFVFFAGLRMCLPFSISLFYRAKSYIALCDQWWTQDG